MDRARLWVAVLAPVLIALAAPLATAAEIDGFHPRCGAPGDLLYVQGGNFADLPRVTLGARRAEVIRARGGAIVCRVPRGLTPGSVELCVDGSAAAVAFEVLPAGCPVVHGLSAEAGTPRQAVFVHGRRLQRGEAIFLDALGNAAATVDVRGGNRAAVFRVPGTLEAGPYTLVFRNGNDRTTSVYAPVFEVVTRREPALFAIRPALAPPLRSATPGQRIQCVGTDLGPWGTCRVHWQGDQGARTTSKGRSNGYDCVCTTMPASLEEGRCYAVSIEVRGGVLTRPLRFVPGDRPTPCVTKVEPSAGPSGGCVAVGGVGLASGSDGTRVKLRGNAEDGTAEVVYRHPGGFGRGAAWIVRVRDDVPSGEYGIVATVGSRASTPIPFRVEALPLAVTGLWPRRQVGTGSRRPAVLEGSGFVSADPRTRLRVVWSAGERAYEGHVVFRSERLLRVLPPGSDGAPLPSGIWTVSVIRELGEETKTAKAGSWEVVDGD